MRRYHLVELEPAHWRHAKMRGRRRSVALDPLRFRSYDFERGCRAKCKLDERLLQRQADAAKAAPKAAVEVHETEMQARRGFDAPAIGLSLTFACHPVRLSWADQSATIAFVFSPPLVRNNKVS